MRSPLLLALSAPLDRSKLALLGRGHACEWCASAEGRATLISLPVGETRSLCRVATAAEPTPLFFGSSSVCRIQLLGPQQLPLHLVKSLHLGQLRFVNLDRPTSSTPTHTDSGRNTRNRSFIMSALHKAHDFTHMASSPKTLNVCLKPTFLICPVGIAPACLVAAPLG